MALNDVWETTKARLLVGCVFAGYAVLLAVIFTGKPVPLWTVYAYTSGLVLLGIGRIPVRLLGYNGLWERVVVPQAEPAGGWLLGLQLNFKKAPALRLGYHQIVCEVRDPDGKTYESGHIDGGGTMVHCLYPAYFSGAPAVIPGTYAVTWRERTPPETGKQTVMDTGRLKTVS
jgi:hypothetical protein